MKPIFRSLYGRLMVLFLAVLLVAMAMLTFLLYGRIREDKVQERMDELTNQARDVAYLAAQRSLFTTREADLYLIWKSQEITQEYDAYLIIVDRYRNVIPIGDETLVDAGGMTLDETLAYMNRVLEGEEIAERALTSSGSVVFTVGVPYVEGDRLLGAVFIHTSEQSVEASYREILGEVIRALLIAANLGAVLILIASRYFTEPMRQMAQAADRFAHGDFSQRVEVRSRDEVGRLAEAFNSMAQDLERLEQTRRGFVANVSHELRSPLTSMQGFIGGMLDGTIAPEDRDKYLQVVWDETNRLNKLITTLLDLSHIESGKTPLVRTRFDVNEMICRVLARQEPRITGKNLNVAIDFANETCFVDADADRVEQVLVNLVDNSIKYGRESGGTLRVATAEEGGQARVTVANDGPQIPPEDLPFLFERFYKVDKAHTTGKGTGLGLAIVKSILDQHGKKIQAFSDEKETRFEFTLDRG